MSATGRYLDADGNVLNLVSILGSGATPVSEQVHALEQYAPHSGLILGEDGKAYSLVDIIANYKAQLQTESEGYTDGKIDALTGADIALADAGGHYTTKTAEAALQQVASQLAAITPLFFADAAILITDWTASTAYDGYAVEFAIPCTGVTADMSAEVVFAHADAISGNFSPVCATGAGTVTVYAKATPSGTVTIPLIKAVNVA